MEKGKSLPHPGPLPLGEGERHTAAVLTNASGTDQFKFNTNLDNARPELEYSRADYDQTHVFNLNTIYELPFGNSKKWLNQGGAINRIFGGFQLTSIMNIASGAPVSFVDVRGTLNRVSRSART